MIEQITELMIRSGASWVLWLLLGLSVAAVAVALERLWAFRSVEADLPQLVSQLRKHLARQDYQGAEKLLSSRASVASEVVQAGLVERSQGPAAAEEAMAAGIGLSRTHLSRGLLIMGTIGNNAPFIGLLGTVIGVVGAFDALAVPAAGDMTAAASAGLAPERVMATIAEALVATAVGLLVAIPAVAAFNYFQGRLNAAVRDAETLGHVLLAHLRGAPGSSDRSLVDDPARSASDAEMHTLRSQGGAFPNPAE